MTLTVIHMHIESSALAQEIAGLKTLEYEMARSLDALKQHQADAKFAKTVAGRLFTWGGRVFAAYCIYRILSVRPPFLPGSQSPQVDVNANSNPRDSASST